MSQHDYTIANDVCQDVRLDIQAALQALASNNLGAVPSAVFAGMWHLYSTTQQMRIRNVGDSAWVTMPFSCTTSNRINDGVHCLGDFAVDDLLEATECEFGDNESDQIVKIVNTHSSGLGAFIHSDNGAFAGTTLGLVCDRAGNSAYRFILCQSNYAGSADNEFYVRGDGEVYADGAFNPGGADYAEYFEWADGNPEGKDRVGHSVVLVEKGRIEIAGKSADPSQVIGVVSARPAVVADSQIDHWHGKHVLDPLGRRRGTNPEYDPTRAYLSRSERKEWAAIGLIGKLRVRKGQTMGDRWIKLNDINEDVEEWLVR